MAEQYGPFTSQYGPTTAAPTYGLSDLIRDVGPLVTSGAQYLTGNSAIKDAYGNANAGLIESANALKGGYDDKQNIVEAGTDELMQLLTAGLGDVSSKYRMADYGYRDDVRNNVTRYDTVMRPELNNLLSGLSTGNDIYGLQLDDASQRAENQLVEGNDQATAQMQPYADAGAGALDYMLQVMGLDPSKLTPDQVRVMDDLSRDLMANLSASGLRGAGRAGIAAVNEGRADMGAKLYAINQERADKAAANLNTTGYNANSSIAGRIDALNRTLADLKYKTGTAKAQNTYNVTGDIAKSAYDYGKDIGGKVAGADTAATESKYNTAKGIGDITSQYYTGVGNLQANRYSQRAENTFGKSAVDSTTAGNVAANNFAGDASLYKNNSNALDKIGALLTRNQKAAATGQ